MIEKYTFQLEAPRIGREKLILAKGASETRSHIVLKILAYLLFYQSGLQIEAKVQMHFKPDLVAEDEDGKPVLWIDCGFISPRKAQKLVQKLRKTHLVIVKKTRNEMAQFANYLLKKDPACERIEYLGFEAGFVEGIADALEKKNELTMYFILENTIGVVLNERIFESEIYRRHKE